MESDYLKSGDRVSVAMYDTEGNEVFYSNLLDARDITDAIRRTYEASGFTDSAEDYVYKVTDETTDVAHRYRINAGGNVVLLPEEY